MTYAGWALGMGRQEAEALMTDTCRIERPTGVMTTDPDTGGSVPVVTLVYEGKCRFQSRGDWSSERDIGQAGLLLVQVELQLPVSVAPKANDRVTILTAALNPDLPGRQFEVRGDFLKSHNTSRRVMLQQPTG